MLWENTKFVGVVMTVNKDGSVYSYYPSVNWAEEKVYK